MMCRNCGSIVGAGENQCAVCGAQMTGTAPQKARVTGDSEAVRFARAVLDRPYKFTIAILVANLLVFLLMWQSSGLTSAALMEFPEAVLLAYGAKLNSLINEQHQWWRFVTPMFVHVNLPHLLVNMYSLWVVGPYVEKLYGSAKFVVFWVVTGVAGVVASYLSVRPGLAGGSVGKFLFKSNDVLSAGASGALFGLVGVLFVFGIKFRHELPEGFKRAFGTGMLPIIFINLFIGYLGRGFIDNAAHLGGLISGAMLALAVDYRRPGERTGIATIWQISQIAAVGLVAVSFLKTAQHFKDPLPAPLAAQVAEREQQVKVTDPRTVKFVAYTKAMSDAQEAFNLILTRRDLTGTDEAIRNLESTPQLDPKADELKERLKDLLVKAKTLNTAEGNASTPPEKNTQGVRELSTEFVVWSKDYRDWLKTSGPDYGLVRVSEAESPAR
jgi:rhomboid protease GluP